MVSNKIEIEVSLRDCLKFQEFLRDINICNVYDMELEQISSNFWILTTENYLHSDDMEEIINELEEIFNGYEVDIIAEYI